MFKKKKERKKQVGQLQLLAANGWKEEQVPNWCYEVPGFPYGGGWSFLNIRCLKISIIVMKFSKFWLAKQVSIPSHIPTVHVYFHVLCPVFTQNWYNVHAGGMALSMFGGSSFPTDNGKDQPRGWVQQKLEIP